MHNIRPAGQMWLAKAYNLALKAQIIAYLAWFLMETLKKLEKNLTNLARREFWVVHPCPRVFGYGFSPWFDTKKTPCNWIPS